MEEEIQLVEPVQVAEGSLEFSDDRTTFETKEQLYNYFKANGFDMEDIDQDTKLPRFLMKVIKNETAEYNKFNNILYKLNKENKINIIDSMAYLVEDWLEPNFALKCLDEMNYYSLMNSLKQKHNLNHRQDLSEFFA